MHTPITISPILAFRDNYIWALHNSTHAVVVDPGDASPVLAFLAQHHLILCAILITHHHHDHTGGINDLTQQFPVAVYGPALENIPGITCPVIDNQTLQIDPVGLGFTVIDVPGHTSGHVAYHTSGHLFCGDTLFGCGCGRLFEGTPAQMYHSLQRLAQLPPETQVYSAHEYTLNNIAFALSVEPDNPTLIQRVRKDRDRITHHQPTLPSTLGLELATNPFLRCDRPSLVRHAAQSAGHTSLTPEAVFAVLRRQKDEFR